MSRIPTGQICHEAPKTAKYCFSMNRISNISQFSLLTSLPALPTIMSTQPQLPQFTTHSNIPFFTMSIDGDNIGSFPLGAPVPDRLDHEKNLGIRDLFDAEIKPLDVDDGENASYNFFERLGSRKTEVARRKSARAICHLVPGPGRLLINGINMPEYFTEPHLRQLIVTPAAIVDRSSSYDFDVRVSGGGVNGTFHFYFLGQAEAVAYAIALKLSIAEPKLKPFLKAQGTLYMDHRVKERKKAGFKKARKARQWVKR